MRSLEHARQRARETRAQLNADPSGLLAAVRGWLESRFDIEVIPVPAAVIDGSRAEVSPAERVINYDEALDRKPADLLWVLAHELGHLVMHQRLTAHNDRPDPLVGSGYLSDGAAGLARYSRKAREEAEANAFANELLCPASSLLREWQRDAHATTYSLAAAWHLPERLVRVQLAEALLQSLHPASAPQPPTHKPRVEVNERQLAAATFTGAPALVTAGPGTGKTATLIRRIEFLLAEQHAAPHELLVLTFSNDAAEELRDRVAARFDDEVAGQLEIATFHGFGFSFLHQFALDLDDEAVILDEAAQEEIINQLIGQIDCPSLINLRDIEETVKRLARHINFLKDRVIDDAPITPALLLATLEVWERTGADAVALRQARELHAVFVAYEQAKRARPAVDFADLIAEPIRVLDEQPRLVARLREKYRWVMVDEYQDVSRTVALLLRKLCGRANPPWVVGDMRQAIYRFRGAAPENVRDFHRDFPGARVFELDVNYRSCAAVVNAANQLASLLDVPAELGESLSAVWQAGSAQTQLNETPVAIARVNADVTEYEGIAAQVRAWLEQGVAAGDIAVLARRNLDVRNIVLALGARGIRATTSGLLTAEGAAGDLAAVVTWLDEKKPSLPRLVYALGRGRCDNAALNALIAQLTEAVSNNVEIISLPRADETAPVLEELQRAWATLQSDYHAADAFGLLCAFLFNASDYLRRVLVEPDAARRTLALSEIITTLARAASFRFSHPDEEPRRARLGFAQHFRAKLNASAPSVDVPHADADAVRVMTCHASKGLEFPCVIVAGQTLGQARENWWLPAALQPSAADETAQADALLFVGVTRAQRAVVVSCADSKSGGQRARQRATTPLLERWQEVHQIAALAWPALTAATETIATNDLWGGAARRYLAARALDDKQCAVRTYLEDFVGVRFPVLAPPQYPAFYVALRSACEQVVVQAQAAGERLNTDAAALLFDLEFSERKFGAHPHFPIYQRYGREYARRFARAYTPEPGAVEFLETTLDEAGWLALRFDLIALFRTADETHALLLRPESLADNLAKNADDALNWSALDTSKRLAFLLLKQRLPNLQPRVFSATDGVLYRYLWSQRAINMATESERIHERWRAFGRKQFTTKLNEHACNRCPARIACPHWLAAL